MSRFAETLDRLAATIAARRGADPSTSYTARLLAEGAERQGKKLGEEAIETVIAAVKGDADALAGESADLIYHWLVLLAGAGVELDAVAAKLEAREGRSGLEEKASRGVAPSAPPAGPGGLRFEPRPGKLFSEWHVMVTWPDGRTQRVDGFKDEAHARGWVDGESKAWAASQRGR